MYRGIAKKTIFLLIVGLFLIFSFSGLLQSETNAKGNVLGYIYGSDGTTPYEGAVLTAMNVTTRSVYESTVSNSNGVLKITGLETGFYDFAVTTAEGTFISENILGLIVREDETEKMAISVNSVSKKAKAKPMGFPEPEAVEGEPYIGRVIGIDLASKVAEVYIVRGMVKTNDKVHIKGSETDFGMKVKELNKEGNNVSSLIAGETGVMLVKENAAIGDAIYLVADKGILPLILGAAGLTAGTAGVVGYANVTAGTEGVIEYDKFKWDPKEGCNPEPRSAFRPKH
jgi:hypothetical protein